MLNYLIILVTVATGALLLYPKVVKALLWRAAITPLASIIGSGFLVLGPILVSSFGQYAPIVMIVLCLVAYLFGSAIRFNIARIETCLGIRSFPEERLENSFVMGASVRIYYFGRLLSESAWGICG